MACLCEGWKKGYPEIDKLISLGFSHEIYYQGGVWEFCPWCGVRINNPPNFCIHEFTETTSGQVYCIKCGNVK